MTAGRRAAVHATFVIALFATAAWPDAAAAQGKKRDVDRYDHVFRKYSKRYFGVGYDWRIFKAQALAESEMNPNARSWVGARGLMQLMPST
ncbi:MAG TPA: transglycosylase SLT domain-containing protein, partial [Gemmatimonadaceae bacterium]|nr:transglycosylase SLT domain-containing protein [Gemmatimonadaceae bacterium]